MKKLSIRPAMADCMALFCIVLFSAMPYLGRLGFYSDDWNYQAALARSSGQGLRQMLHALLAADEGMLIRPGQFIYLVLGFKAFGRNAFAYHFVNSVVLGLVAALVYLVLSELKAGRWISFTVALLFGLLPHYSTGRFWISSHQATLSIAFALLGIYAMLRSVRPEGGSSKTWAALAGLALVLSILCYEVVLGLIAASVVVITVRGYRHARAMSQSPFKHLGGVAFVLLALFVAGIIKVAKQTRIPTPTHVPAHLGDRAVNFVAQALRFNLWTYGFKMPAVLVAMHRQSALSVQALASATVIAVLVTAYLWRYVKPATTPARRTCLVLIAAGFVIFGLGYGLFFSNNHVDFSSAGIENRVVIASALGVPFVLAGIIGLAASILSSPLARLRSSAVAIGLLCGMNALMVNGISFYWTGAAAQQTAILHAVNSDVRSLPDGSVLLLDGFCRYSGPAIVFETDWDSTGALRLLMGNNSLTADVVSPTMTLHDDAVETAIYGEQEGSYPYGDRLFVFNVRQHTLTNLPSKDVALAYLRAINPTQDSGCPAGREGRGTKVF